MNLDLKSFLGVLKYLFQTTQKMDNTGKLFFVGICHPMVPSMWGLLSPETVLLHLEEEDGYRGTVPLFAVIHVCPEERAGWECSSPKWLMGIP